ncbi:hypothetical protein QBC42DRAFT_264323 [Cladorrhinum samala]|uniref:Uncharacterized protein n=1 Tax=Cladorrhinum samala TaxID=585594 RepID=A0AAV9HTV0_9PEZI|nr:hypothetical protein QBC42DRAFT_264323 [Cladorrhinum samala]
MWRDDASGVVLTAPAYLILMRLHLLTQLKIYCCCQLHAAVSWRSAVMSAMILRVVCISGAVHQVRVNCASATLSCYLVPRNKQQHILNVQFILLVNCGTLYGISVDTMRVFWKLSTRFVPRLVGSVFLEMLVCHLICKHCGRHLTPQHAYWVMLLIIASV